VIQWGGLSGLLDAYELAHGAEHIAEFEATTSGTSPVLEQDAVNKGR
jgi:hypothetical protein